MSGSAASSTLTLLLTDQLSDKERLERLARQPLSFGHDDVPPVKDVALKH